RPGQASKSGCLSDRYAVLTGCLLCSEPSEIEEVRPSSIGSKIREQIGREEGNLGDVLWHIYEGFENRSEIRRPRLPPIFVSRDAAVLTPDERRRTQRSERLDRLKSGARSPEDAVGAALGLELWALGVQLLLVSETDD
ncbi:hypothetical protein QRQ56_16215, partial [Bradyrhizobium sp. U531]|uniref:hypothetical protein n=1 Tax=Bradyrhizobium sp. U531 TaxID=3053458 RepID=UPI003F43D79B